MHVPTSEIGARLVIMTVTSIHGVGGALFLVESNAGIPYLDSPKEKFVDAKLIDMLCKLLTGSALRWHAFAKETYVLENSNPGLRAPHGLIDLKIWQTYFLSTPNIYRTSLGRHENSVRGHLRRSPHLAVFWPF